MWQADLVVIGLLRGMMGSVRTTLNQSIGQSIAQLCEDTIDWMNKPIATTTTQVCLTVALPLRRSVYSEN